MERHQLADYDALGLPPDEALRRVIARADADSQFFEDLEQLMFELAPMTPDQLDCHAPKFFVVAMDGGGGAFGRYVDPQVAQPAEAGHDIETHVVAAWPAREPRPGAVGQLHLS